MSRVAILNWKQRSAERRDFRSSRGDPEVPRGRHRRKAGGCKKARDDQHPWGEWQVFNYAIDALDEPLGYEMRTCTLCFKKDYRWT